MKKLTTIAVLSIMTLTSGCATQRANISPSASQTVGYEKSETFFIGGIGQEQTVNAAEVCGGASKVASVETSQKPMDIALTMITMSIYTPRTSTVNCR